MLLDMYEQLVVRDLEDSEPSALGALSEPQIQRAIQWWKKLRL